MPKFICPLSGDVCCREDCGWWDNWAYIDHEEYPEGAGYCSIRTMSVTLQAMVEVMMKERKEEV